MCLGWAKPAIWEQDPFRLSTVCMGHWRGVSLSLCLSPGDKGSITCSLSNSEVYFSDFSSCYVSAIFDQ